MTGPSFHEPGATGATPATPAPRAAPRRLLHPVSGATLLALDWLVFTSGWLTALTTTPLATLAASALTLLVTLWAQRRDGDGRAVAALKAIVAAALVAVPLPIAGTAVGGLVLAQSGLAWLSRPRR